MRERRDLLETALLARAAARVCAERARRVAFQDAFKPPVRGPLTRSAQHTHNTAEDEMEDDFAAESTPGHELKLTASVL